MMISLFYVTIFVLNAKLCSIYALILKVFGGLNYTTEVKRRYTTPDIRCIDMAVRVRR